MNSNIVKVISGNQSGTGVLLECEYDVKNNDEFSKYNYFIVLTCYHIIDENADNIKFEIINSKGDMLEKNKDYIIIDESPKKNKLEFIKELEYRNDIKAYLIGISVEHNILINYIICEKNKNQFLDTSKVSTLGYPGMLSDEKTVNSMYLEGDIVDINIKKKNIGAYALEKNIIWYVNLSQKDQLNGFSGGPVYKKINDKRFLIGINESIPKLDEGNNPYSLIYYIKIQYIFDYLRRIGCIIYEVNSDRFYKIKWLNKNTVYNFEKNILVIGSSGAGKSSFIKTFSKNAELIDSSGDGQTTRMDIEYEFLLKCPIPQIKIEFMDEKLFSEKMVQGLDKHIISLLLNEYYMLDEVDLEKDCLSCIKKLYIPLRVVTKNLQAMNNDSEKKKNIENLIKNLKHLIDEINKCLLIDYISDWELINIYIELMKNLDKLLNDKEINIFKNKNHFIFYFNESKRKELFNKLRDLRILNEHIGSYKESNKEWIDKLYRDNKYKGIFDNEYENIDKKEDYLNIIYNFDGFENYDSDNANQYPKQEQTIIEFFINKKGYFLVDELNFLKCNEKINELITTFVRENFFENNCLAPNKYFNMVNHSEGSLIKSLYMNIFKKIYNKLEGFYSKDNSVIKLNNRKVELKFEEVDKDTKDFIAMCLKPVKSGKSLSGIIKSIKVTDIVSDNYTYLFDNLRINKLKFIDTCGLDHIEKGRNIKRSLEDIFDRNKEANIKLDAVIYLKKLDSGKPTELENILPLIFEVEPNIALYSVFTGIDILYENSGESENLIIWDEEENDKYPKAVNYLLSDDGEKDIKKNLICRKEKKDLIYKVFSRNIIAYSSKNYSNNQKNYFIESNKFNIRKLLKSIIIKEHNSVEIINENKIIEIMETKSFNLELKKSIIKVFERASISSWNEYHHMISKANARRINREAKEKSLGFWGVYRNMWYQLFYDAYNYIFSIENKELLECFTSMNSIDKIEAIISNLRESFFGNYNNLYSIEIDENKKSEFRKIFEKMYSAMDKDGELIYKNNPFDKNRREELIAKNTEKSCSYLLDVVNFKKGLYGSDLESENIFLDKFVQLFKSKFYKQINLENKECIRNFKKINPNIIKNLNKISRDIYSFFGYDKNTFSDEKIDIFIKHLINNGKNKKIGKI